MFTRKLLVFSIACLGLLGGAIPLVVSAATMRSDQSSEKAGSIIATNDTDTSRFNINLPIINKSLCGEIKNDTTWMITGSPYQATCDVIIPVGVTLTIEAGVKVQFARQDTDLIIYGTLQTAGTESAPITFQPSSGTIRGNWGRIAFMSGSSGVLDHTILEYGGSSEGMVYIASDAVRVENSIVQYSANTGIYIHAASPLISVTQILTNTAGAGGGGIYNDTGNPIIQSSIIRNNSTLGYSYGDAGGGGIYNKCGNPIIQNNRFIGNIAEYDDHGGGLYSGCGRPFIQNNIFAGNVAKNYELRQYTEGNFGGGIYSSGDPIILNNVFTGNIVEGGFMVEWEVGCSSTLITR